ncbi:uncharacterized protein LOC118735975 [Rhagoletis pomonella]|uniref:uncharacterized protein LOC118735975 n=1 Tax=Rhagoletis pomonella TaxID=28610 RepID=UPI00177AE80D|nr:uncharacterized protein LOC118735975 [Rhagoletis pomonella]
MGKWSVKDMIKIIELFKSHPSLWDLHSHEYRMKRKKQKDIRFIANSMGVEKAIIDKKWKSLRTIYKSELNKIEASKRTGKEYVSPWRYFGYMSFLYQKRNHSQVTIKESMSPLKMECDESDHNETIVDTNHKSVSGHEESNQSSGDGKKSEVENNKWSEERIVELIHYFEAHPLLWNPNDEEFKINYKKDEALSQISKLMGIPKEDIKKKWRILRTQFKSELNKMRKSKSIDDLYVSDWRYLRPLKFLYDSCNAEESKEYCYIFDQGNDSEDDENTHLTLSNCELEKTMLEEFPISTEVKREWSPQSIYQLIQQYKEHPSLWDKSTKDSRLKSIREKDICQVAENMGMEKGDIERKWKSLRTHCSAELRKIKESHASGSNRVYFSNWRFLKAMKFVYDTCQENETCSNEISSFPCESDDSLMEITVVQTSQDEEYEDAKECENSYGGEDENQNPKRKHETVREENDSTVTKLRKVEQSFENNECDIFCSLMATKLRKLNSNLRDEAMRKLMRVMWDFEDAQKQSSSMPSPCDSFENI